MVPFDLGMPPVTDHDHLAPLTMFACYLDVHLRYQWAGGIEYVQAARLGIRAHLFRNPVGAEYDRGTDRNLANLFHKDRTLGTQVINDEFVVYDFMANKDRCAEAFQCTLDDVDRPVYAGAKPAWISQQYVHVESLRSPNTARLFS